MFRIAVPWLLLAAVTPEARAAVYQHTDARGHVVWSDRPGGTRIDVPVPRVLSPPAAAGGPATPSLAAPSFTSYQRVALKPRAATVTLEQAGRGVALRLETVPRLRPEDRVQLSVDGRRHQSPLSSHVLMAVGLGPGRHALVAEVLDRHGVVRQRSAIMTLEVLPAAASEAAAP